MTDRSHAAAPAATIVLLRENRAGKAELFMVERASTMGFAGGAMVFPGGKVDAADRDLLTEASRAPGLAALDPVDAAARVAAVRETFEEAGVLLTEGPPLAPSTRADLRARLLDRSLSFGRLLDEIDHHFIPERLVPFARWVPPLEVTHRRYDTHFFLSRMPEGEEALHDGGENVRSHWISAEGALELDRRGQASLIFPTRRNLERLALHASVDALIAAARATEPPFVMPFVEERDGGFHMCIDPALGYPVNSEPYTQPLTTKA